MGLTSINNARMYQLLSVGQAQEVLESQLAERILIVGSGVLECMIAIELAEQGKEITLVEKTDELLLDCLDTPKRVELLKKLEYLVVTIFLETSVSKVLENQVCLCSQEGFETFLDIDNMIVPKKL
ncbi:hypothetical protein UAW_02260 [Enterococcus haemoperoxidus ATCC BAA-382]|uniref:FAD/NAD(P)-binding domain-containing protein n=1 Tax=Enterococcus haemoperoxidus ATCC BAA-382 TaxID=1158608 RepID=R2T2R7_9ENTE|nr:FAD/NAD(P)-binding oxidoreductase [Enterococcus haemoperoxidus]EOH94534.1 hypothetical protein UAW_02260 [Enterococcus haemoperoxidus ATCC BAA-382]EOT60579.1 hypothetical protein I583_03225 [Enterococcus haemoperoxidus ATCC BAA-382]OJG52858.1 hypothetical protein RV06_GL000890 [Enterococcus haemoperoxidus]